MKTFGILENNLGVYEISGVFEEEKRSIGTEHPVDREWYESVGSRRSWWATRYIQLTTKRVL